MQCNTAANRSRVSIDGRPCKNFPHVYSLVTIQNLVVVSDTVRTNATRPAKRLVLHDTSGEDGDWPPIRLKTVGFLPRSATINIIQTKTLMGHNADAVLASKSN